MTDIALSHSTVTDSAVAGQQLGEEIARKLDGIPDALIVFASPIHDFGVLLRVLNETCTPRILVGCSSAGEFSSTEVKVQSACAVAIRSSEMAFSVGVGRNLRASRREAAESMCSSFKGLGSTEFAYRTAMVLTDTLAGYADELIEELTRCTEGLFQFFGGGAGDDVRLDRTYVFFGAEVLTDTAVALEILSNKPIGVGVKHGWEPASEAMRVTDAEGNRVITLNAAPAIEAFQAHAEATNQSLDQEQPVPFFLSNILGIETNGNYRLRSPVGINDKGEVTCVAEVPQGSIVRIMRTSSVNSAEAAAQATKAALEQLDSYQPKIAVFFDCAATRLRTGLDFGLELKSLQNTLAPASYIGCNTYGQIARAGGQFGGFHNCTAVVGVFPD